MTCKPAANKGGLVRARRSKQRHANPEPATKPRTLKPTRTIALDPDLSCQLRATLPWQVECLFFVGLGGGGGGGGLGAGTGDASVSETTAFSKSYIEVYCL